MFKNLPKLQIHHLQKLQVNKQDTHTYINTRIHVHITHTTHPVKFKKTDLVNL